MKYFKIKKVGGVQYSKKSYPRIALQEELRIINVKKNDDVAIQISDDNTIIVKRVDLTQLKIKNLKIDN